MNGYFTPMQMRTIFLLLFCFCWVFFLDFICRSYYIQSQLVSFYLFKFIIIDTISLCFVRANCCVSFRCVFFFLPFKFNSFILFKCLAFSVFQIVIRAKALIDVHENSLCHCEQPKRREKKRNKPPERTEVEQKLIVLNRKETNDFDRQDE